MKKYILVSLFLSLLLASCSNKETKKNIFPNGDYYLDYLEDDVLVKRETYTKAGLKDAVIKFKNGKLDKSTIFYYDKMVAEYASKNDSVHIGELFYYENKTIYGEGKLDEFSREIGWWSFYDENHNLLKKQHNAIINNTKVIGQLMVYKDGVLDTLHSDFSDIKFTKSKGGRSSYIAELIYNRKINKNSYVSLLVGSNINEDFSNIEIADFDTIAFTTKSKMEFPVLFEKSGKITLRGVIVEQYSEDNPSSTKPIDILERRSYIDKEFFID